MEYLPLNQLVMELIEAGFLISVDIVRSTSYRDLHLLATS